MQIQGAEPRIGVQISSFRHGPMEFEERIRTASAIGFDGVELIHWGPRPSPDPATTPAEEAREILEMHGVEPVAVHMPGLAKFEQDFDRLTDYHLRLGTPYLIVALIGEEVGFSTENPEAWADCGKRLKALSVRCRDLGLSLGVHNHVLELLPVAGRTGLLRLFDETDPGDLLWEADIGHIAASRIDFNWLMRQAGDRCRLMHVKDLGPEVHEKPTLEEDGMLRDFEHLASPIRERIEWEVDLGSGVIELDNVFRWARSIGVEWLLSEQHKAGLDLKQACAFLNSGCAG